MDVQPFALADREEQERQMEEAYRKLARDTEAMTKRRVESTQPPEEASWSEVSDTWLWQQVTYDLKHYQGGPIYASVKYLQSHPAMREILRRERSK